MVVDPNTNQPLPPTKEGELWIRGPTIMKGNRTTLQIVYYVFDELFFIY